MDQFDSSSCETFFSRLWLNVDLSINDSVVREIPGRYYTAREIPPCPIPPKWEMPGNINILLVFCVTCIFNGVLRAKYHTLLP